MYVVHVQIFFLLAKNGVTRILKFPYIRFWIFQMAILPSLHIFFCNFYFLIFFEKFFFFKTHKNTYKNLFVDDQNYYWSTSSSMTSWKKRETIYSVEVFIKGAIVFLSIDEFYHCEYDIDIQYRMFPECISNLVYYETNSIWSYL